MRRFSIYARDVLLSLWRKADYYKSDTFFCSDKQIAEDIGIHPDTVKRAKRYLAASGWVQFTSGKYEGRATEYKILRRHDGRKIFIPLWRIKSPADSTPLESPAESPAVSRPSNIYNGNTSLASASSDPVSTASACASAVPVIKEELRSFEDIRREHPDAIRSPYGTISGQWGAMWTDISKKSGFDGERCL